MTQTGLWPPLIGWDVLVLGACWARCENAKYVHILIVQTVGSTFKQISQTNDYRSQGFRLPYRLKGLQMVVDFLRLVLQLDNATLQIDWEPL